MKKINIHSDCEKDKKEILRTFENTILKVLESVDKTQNKFMEMVSKIEIEHFKQLNKQQGEFLDKQTELVEAMRPVIPLPKLEELSRLDYEEKIPNDIEEGKPDEFPLGDLPNIPITDALKVQVEGEESIYPIDMENKIL